MPVCPYSKSCGIELTTEAETFLHRELHREPWESMYNSRNLNGLPYALMPRIARLMQDYHDFMQRREAGEETLEGWPCSAGFAPRAEG
jgi:hypothetical protein